MHLTSRSTLLYLIVIFTCVLFCADPIDNSSNDIPPEKTTVTLSVLNKTDGTVFKINELITIKAAITYPRLIDSVLVDFGEKSNQNNFQINTDYVNSSQTIYLQFSIAYKECGKKRIKVTTTLIKSSDTRMAEHEILVGTMPKISNKKIQCWPQKPLLNNPCSLWVNLLNDSVCIGARYLWHKNKSPLFNQTGRQIIFLSLSKVNEGSYGCIVSNELGSDTTEDFNLQITDNPKPVIVQHPRSIQATAGSKITFSCKAEPADVNYQWQKNEIPINNAKSSDYTIDSVALADDNSKFRCMVSNTNGSVLSEEAILSVFEKEQPPKITKHPENAVVKAGENAYFLVEVKGTNLSYQWKRNNELIIGANQQLFTIKASETDSGSRFRCLVSNSSGSEESNEAILIVNKDSKPQKPTIIDHPKDVQATEGGEATFSVSATGTDLMYQWLKNNVDIIGASKPSYSVKPVTKDDHGFKFKCRVYNSVCGEESKEACLIVVSVTEPPKIIKQPENKTVKRGETATFLIEAQGTDLTFQWKKSDIDIPGAIANTHTTPQTEKIDNNAIFKCIVKNSAGKIESQPATLTVQWPPSIKLNPTDLIVLEGAEARFTVETEEGNPSVTRCKWMNKNGIIVSETQEFRLTAKREDNEQVYTCVVSNEIGQSVSVPAKLTVEWPPKITSIKPMEATIKEGAIVAFSITGKDEGNPKCSYEWKSSSGETKGCESECSFPAAKSDNGRQFFCIATNKIGASESQKAKLTVHWPPSNISLSQKAIEGNEGASVTIEALCTEGNPPAQFKWTIADQPVNSTEKSIQLNLQKNYNLKNLTCKAVNSAGETSIATTPVSVYWKGALSLISNTGKTEYTEGDLLSYTASLVDWNPLPADSNIQWKYDKTSSGKNLSTPAVYQATQITCIASNKVGFCTLASSTIKVYRKDDLPTQVNMKSDKDEYTIGEQAKITCTTTGGSLPFNIKWIVNGSITSTETNVKSSSTVKSFAAEIGMNFRCYVSMYDGHPTGGSAMSDILRLKVKEANKPPVWANEIPPFKDEISQGTVFINLREHIKDENIDSLKFSIISTEFPGGLLFKPNGFEVYTWIKVVLDPGDYKTVFEASDGEFKVQSPVFHIIY
ncbi:MAG: immunoglobulin domain-containing protein [Chitinivibrionales bacterium]|nr:immunoglobulin domain-containing protein [Chitinivibrionales bacterium]